MKRLVRWLAAVLFVCLVCGCQAPAAGDQPAPSASTEGTAAAAELAPDFTLTALDGEPVALSALRGRWVLVNFWATWCVPCRDEMPYLAALAETHGDKLTVLAVNMREDPAQISAFAVELGVKLPILLEPDNATLLAYNVQGLPLSFLIAPDGTLVRRFAGPLRPGEVEGEIAAHGNLWR